MTKLEKLSSEFIISINVQHATAFANAASGWLGRQPFIVTSEYSLRTTAICPRRMA
jgi:hypothetical protein